ncbi:hypothetical protein N6K39_004633 [Escherichia coli]|nr:hypothetical protein [Escherichia coli]
MDEERVFSLSYEQLTRFTERRIRECNLDSQGAIYLCESAKAAKWHLNRSQFGIRIDHDLASISDHSLASQSITIWHASDH